jgi:ATP-dependent Clp protease adaptor protein ClpS
LPPNFEGIMEKTKTKVKDAQDIAYPSRYKVIIYNDDATPIDYVIQLLINVFNKNIEEAQNITMQIHENDKAIAGIYSFEIAEQKMLESNLLSRKHGYPLEVDVEEA